MTAVDALFGDLATAGERLRAKLAVSPLADYDKDIETRLERLRQAIHGVQILCL
jgi:hypothetical protein